MDEECCGLQRFSPYVGQFCCGGTVAYEPEGCGIIAPAYHITKQVCLYGETIGRDTDCPADNNIRYFCCGGVIANVPVMPCVLEEDFPDEICCGVNRMSMEWNVCCGTFTGKTTLIVHKWALYIQYVYTHVRMAFYAISKLEHFR